MTWSRTVSCCGGRRRHRRPGSLPVGRVIADLNHAESDWSKEDGLHQSLRLPGSLGYRLPSCCKTAVSSAPAVGRLLLTFAVGRRCRCSLWAATTSVPYCWQAAVCCCPAEMPLLRLSGCHLVVCSRFGRSPFRRRHRRAVAAAVCWAAEAFSVRWAAGSAAIGRCAAAAVTAPVWAAVAADFTERLLLSAVWPLLLLTSAGRLWLSPSSVRCRRRRGRPRLLLGSCCGCYRLCVATARVYWRGV